MAGVRIHPLSIAFSGRGFRLAERASVAAPRFLVVHSRASSSFLCGPRLSRRKNRVEGNVAGMQLSWRCGEGVAFSTSAVKRLTPKNERDVVREEEKSPSSTSKLRQAISSKLSAARHENIYTIPNILTFSRLIATPVLGYLIVTNQPTYAFFLFAYAGLSDLVDGWIARRWKQQTVIGSVVDPMADKALMTTMVACLAANGSLPLPLATLILGRDISLAGAAIYYRYASLPAPKTMSRYWDFSLPSAEVHPTTVSKFNTFLQLGLIGATMCIGLMTDPTLSSAAATAAADTATTATASTKAVASSAIVSVLDSVREALGGMEGAGKLMKGFQGVVAATTLWSGMSYAFNKSAVTILGSDEALKRRQGARGRAIIGVSFGLVIAGAGVLWWKDVAVERRSVLKVEENKQPEK